MSRRGKRKKDKLRHKTSVALVVVDEGVSEAELDRFVAYANKQGFEIGELLLIAERHPGIPDGEILRLFLGSTTLLVTKDRPFHNRVLSKGLRSVHLDGDRITQRRLSGIRVKPDPPHLKKDTDLKESYHPPKTDLRPLLLPAAARPLKNLRTKRRRIRNHFGGLDHLDRVAITVSWKEREMQTLIGVRLQVSSNVGLKAITASESYVAEHLPPAHQGQAALCHALVLGIQLMLNSIRSLVYFDADKISAPSRDLGGATSVGFAAFLSHLRDCYQDLAFVPVTKGRHLERLRQKLVQLTAQKTNEVRPGRLQDLMEKVCQHQSLPFATDGP